jgi:hypothetical protein
MVVTSVAAAVLLVGALGGLAISGAFGGNGTAASAAITTAASQSLGQKSVEMTLHVDVSAAGTSEQISGNGAFDFTNQSGTMTVTVPVNGQQYTEQVILAGQTAYVSLPPGAQELGKSWASEDVSQFSSGSDALGSGFSQFEDPASLLQRLQSMGGTVTPLGATTFDGSAVDAYSVEVTGSQLQQDLGQSPLPSSLKQFASGLSLPNVDLRVSIGTDGLLRGIDIPFSLSIAGQSISEHFEMTFSNYGTPVSVAPPPADQVVPLSQISGGGAAGGLGGLGNTGTTGTTGSL